MISRVLATGLMAGLVAGLAVAALQHVTTTPLILAAETFEAAQRAAHGEASEVALFIGHARTLATSIATIAVCVGYGLILLAAMLVAGETIEPRRAALWGACGFAATGLATSLGLAPQLPGAAETALLGRQIWWVATAACTAGGLFALLRSETLAYQLAGVALIIAPHIFGAPQPAAPESTVPAEIAARFAASSLAVQALTWVLAGALAGLLWRRFNAAAEDAS